MLRSINNLISLIIGMALNTYLTYITFDHVSQLVDMLFPVAQFDQDFLGRRALPYLASAVSLVYFGVMGFLNIKVAHRAVILILGIRIPLPFGEGYAWILPFPLMGFIDESVAAHEVDVGDKEYLSRNNVPIRADVSVILAVVDPRIRQNLQADIDELAKNLAEEAVRRYISERIADSQDTFATARSAGYTEGADTEATESNEEIKASIMTNGRDRCMTELNTFFEKYGVICDRVIVENVRLPEDVEKAAAEQLRESLESLGDVVDWENTADLVRRMTVVYSELGLNFGDLDKAQQERMLTVLTDQVLAKKGQGQRTSVGVQGTGSPFVDAAGLIAAGQQPK